MSVQKVNIFECLDWPWLEKHPTVLCLFGTLSGLMLQIVCTNDLYSQRAFVDAIHYGNDRELLEFIYVHILFRIVTWKSFSRANLFGTSVVVGLIRFCLLLSLATRSELRDSPWYFRCRWIDEILFTSELGHEIKTQGSKIWVGVKWKEILFWAFIRGI